MKVAIGSSCTGKVQWKRKEGVIQSTPTVAGSIVWQVGWHAGAVLIGIDGRSGRVLARRTLGKDVYYVGPAILDGKMYLGSFGGCRARATVTGSADVAQLVEHFTRNEGVRGSNPRVGSSEASQKPRSGGVFLRARP